MSEPQPALGRFVRQLRFIGPWEVDRRQVLVAAVEWSPLLTEAELATTRVEVAIPFICIADAAGHSTRGETRTPSFSDAEAIALCDKHRAALETWASDVYRRNGRPKRVRLLSTSYIDR